MFKNMRLVILFDILLNPSCKMTASFANTAGTTASASKFIYYERFQIIRNWVYNNAIEEIVSNTSKFEKLSEGPTFKRKA